MTIDFYYYPISPPCRMVMMLAKALGIHLNLKLVNVLKGEQMKPEFLKMNPQHIIPTLDDNGFVLSESRPIMGYLVSKYAKNDSMYPKDPKKKGIVDQRLFFDIGTLYNNVFKCWILPAFNMEPYEVEKLQAVERSFEILNVYLEENVYIAGEDLTIADFSILVSVTMSEIFGFDVARYDNVAAWYERCKAEVEKYGYDEFKTASSALGEFFRANVEVA